MKQKRINVMDLNYEVYMKKLVVVSLNALLALSPLFFFIEIPTFGMFRIPMAMNGISSFHKRYAQINSLNGRTSGILAKSAPRSERNYNDKKSSFKQENNYSYLSDTKSFFKFGSLAAALAVSSALALWQTTQDEESDLQENNGIDRRKYPELSKFVKRFALPTHLRDEFKIEFGCNFSTHLYKKGYDIHRIINAERMRRCIDKVGANQFDVAKKYVVNKEGTLIVLADRIKASSQGKMLSLKDVQQLAKIAEETGYRDWSGNLLLDKNSNKLVFIDTEDSSYAVGAVRGIDGRELPQHCKAQYVISLMAISSAMEEPARKWLLERINELANSPEGTKEEVVPFHNTKWDDATINCEKVKEEFKAYKIEIEKKEDEERKETKRLLDAFYQDAKAHRCCSYEPSKISRNDFVNTISKPMRISYFDS